MRAQKNVPFLSMADDVSVADKNEERRARNRFLVALASTILFMIASWLYLWLAVSTLDYQHKIKDVPDYEEEDDYVWQGPRDVWISKYMMIYFSGALSFLIVGILDFIRRKTGYLGVCMTLAGCFGVASAMTVDKNEYLAIVLNSASVHLFLLEALQLLFRRPTGLEFWFRMSDIFFLGGAIIYVVLSYIILKDKFQFEYAQVGLFAACLWLAASFIRIGYTISMYRRGGFIEKEEPKKESLAYDMDKLSEISS